MADLYSMMDVEDEERWGGPQGDEDEEARKREERERKKAEVRKRLEESGKKKSKKGFLTPERKKKLRVSSPRDHPRKLLMIKAAEDLKQQQLLKEQERQKTLESRVIKIPDVDKIENQAELEKIAKQLVAKIMEIEDSKYDLDFNVRQKDHEINELTIAVNDLRGKFVKPTLKKVSKYDNKFKKMAGSNPPGSMKVNFRDNLKVVKQDKYGLEDLKAEKPEGDGEAAAE